MARCGDLRRDCISDYDRLRILRTLRMLFIETPYFTRFCEEHATDEELSKLQSALIEQPDAGELIRGIPKPT